LQPGGRNLEKDKDVGRGRRTLHCWSASIRARR